MDYIYLLLISFLSATFLPLGSEALLLYYISENLNIYYLLLFATVGNTLGSLFNYYLGKKGEEYLEYKNIINKNSITKYKSFFSKYGGFTLLLSWVPIIGDPITFIAGVFHYSLKKFLIIVFVAKFLRYLVISLLI